MNLSELKGKIIQVDWRIKEVLKESGYLDTGEMEIEYDYADPEQNFLATELRRLLSHMDDIHGTLKYLQRPIAHEGILHMNQNGRYEVDGVELTCGSPLEVLVHDEGSDYPEWVASRIEADHEYYFVARRNLPLEGKRAKIREREW